MFRQGNNSTGDGGFTIPETELPDWIADLDTVFSFAFWHYQYDGDAVTFRTLLNFHLDSSNSINIRSSETSFTSNIEVAGTNQTLRRTGGSGNAGAAVGEWRLCVGYFDPSGANLDMKIWNIGESATDPSSTLNFILLDAGLPPHDPADLVSSGELRVGALATDSASQCWYGIIGGITFWKGVKLDAADVTTLWNSKNVLPFRVAASGNLPGPDHDGIFAIPGHSGSNTAPRIAGGNVAAGSHVGDTVEDPHDVQTYWLETGAEDTGELDQHVDNLTVPASNKFTLWEPLRNDP